MRIRRVRRARVHFATKIERRYVLINIAEYVRLVHLFCEIIRSIASHNRTRRTRVRFAFSERIDLR